MVDMLNPTVYKNTSPPNCNSREAGKTLGLDNWITNRGQDASERCKGGS
jgi:hypothetical protein